MKKKGFTLIELMAVIIVLVLIALISAPIINNTIIASQKKAFKTSMTNLIRTLDNDIANKKYEEIPIIYEISESGIKKKDSLNTSEVEYSGVINATGYAHINVYESVNLCVCNEKYCATKTYVEKDISVVKNNGTITCINTSNSEFNFDSIKETDTVEINTKYVLNIPLLQDTEGENIEVEYVIKNSSNQEIGNNKNTTEISNEYTKILNDTITIQYSAEDKSINQKIIKLQTITVVDTTPPI